MNFINCTPHSIHYVLPNSGGQTIEFLPCGHVALVDTKASTTKMSSGAFDVYEADEVGAPYGLPDPKPGTMYIVSAMAGAAYKATRSDIVCPGTSVTDFPVRESGRVVAVTRFKRP